MKNWNWGAFLIGPIWGIRFRVWQAIPLFLFLGIIGAFVNGMYGTEWAWNKRENDDTISFNESQKNWMMIGIGFNVAIAVLIIASLFL
jgi:hypothetical protein